MTLNNMYLTKIVAASLLGDGCVHVPKDGSINAKYSTSKTYDHADYLDWIDDRLSTITKTFRYEHQSTMPNAKKQLTYQTRQHPFYTKFRERMYGTGIKSIDPHYLTLLDWEFLAVWFQEDGTASFRQRPRDKRLDIQIALATNCFSYGDQMLLKKALKEKLNLEWNIRPMRNKKGEVQYTMHLYRKCADIFLDNMQKLVVPSFLYKCQYDKRPEEGDDIVCSVQQCTESSRNDLTLKRE